MTKSKVMFVQHTRYNLVKKHIDTLKNFFLEHTPPQLPISHSTELNNPTDFVGSFFSRLVIILWICIFPIEYILTFFMFLKVL